ncbi:MAG: hypothetical protein CL565_01260 [Alphaproteobacteria bacterium]|nr:hypothetical protein [Alphaproteobacteria bacterium]
MKKTLLLCLLILLLFPVMGVAQVSTAAIKRIIEQEFFIKTRNEVILDDLSADHWTAALMGMTEQLSSGQMKQVETQASFTDSHNTTDVEIAANQQVADASEEMRPSEGLCERQTAASGLVSSDVKMRAAAESISQQNLTSTLNLPGTVGAQGPGVRGERNLWQIQTIYQPGESMNGAVGEATGVTPDDGTRIYGDLFPNFYTQDTYPNVDFSDDVTTDEETDLLAFYENICQTTSLPNPSPVLLRDPQQQDILRDINDIAAVQGLACYSVSSQAALYQEGSGESADFIRAILAQGGGIDEDEMESIMGPNNRPSFMAQMKVLTHYMNNGAGQAAENVNHPADLQRKVVLQDAANLMLKYETYKTLKQTAANLVMINELDLRDEAAEYYASDSRAPYQQD